MTTEVETATLNVRGLDYETYRKIKVLAAEMDCTVAAVLEYLVEEAGV